MRRLTSSVTKYYDRVLAPCGLTVTQYAVLMNVSRSEHSSVTELAYMVELERSTLTRILRPLFKQGLVVDKKEPGARNSQLGLTEEGRKTIGRATPLWLKAQDDVKLKLGEEGRLALEKMVGSLSDI
jgi:DNA-binding MarR family transcriptional regulator